MSTPDCFSPERAAKVPVVMVHGLLGDFGACLQPASPHWQRFDVFAPDLLGYGEYSNVATFQIDLAAQARHVMRLAGLRFGAQSFHLVGHSIGGVIAVLMADGWPTQILSLTNIEGNATLRDAFWSAGIARMTPVAVVDMLSRLRARPDDWLRECGMVPTAARTAGALRCLGRQPAATLQAMAASVVSVTGDSTYADMLRRVFSHIPTALLAGVRSRMDWDLPAWAEQAAVELTLMDDAGHMMMLDDPARFCLILADIVDRQALRANLGHGPSP